MSRTRRDVISAGIGWGAAWLARRAGAQPSAPNAKTIPSSGERITPVGIGTNRYGVGASEAARAPLRATLARFHALGGRLIDTAEEYGSAETVVGDLIRELGVDGEMFVATKVRRIGREAGLRSIEQSFERLGRGVLDLLQVHDLTDYPTQIDTLRALQEAGRVRYVGISTSRTGQHEQVERLMATETFDFVQLSYSLGDRAAARRLLPLAADRGIAVLVNLPFGRGRLFRAVAGRSLPAWAAELDCASWAQFFLKYVVSHPAVTCAIPGTRSEAHVRDNLGAAYGRLPDAALRRRMERALDEIA